MERKVTKLCKKLHNTYDTNYILDYPKEIRDEFEEAIADFGKNQSIRPVLMSLVMNLFLRREKRIREKRIRKQPVFITGPSEITLMTYDGNREGYPKNIYLFGENVHSNEVGCSNYEKKSIEIEDYLEQVFRESPVFISAVHKVTEDMF